MNLNSCRQYLSVKTFRFQIYFLVELYTKDKNKDFK